MDLANFRCKNRRGTSEGFQGNQRIIGRQLETAV
jgi:hypothetical protein